MYTDYKKILMTTYYYFEITVWLEKKKKGIQFVSRHILHMPS